MCGQYTRNGASFPGGAVAVIHPMVNNVKAVEGIRGHVYFSTPANIRAPSTATVLISDLQKFLSMGTRLSDLRIVMQ